MIVSRFELAGRAISLEHQRGRQRAHTDFTLAGVQFGAAKEVQEPVK